MDRLAINGFLMILIGLALGACTIKFNDGEEASRDIKAQKIFERLHNVYGNSRKYTFGVEQPRKENYAHDVFQFVKRMGGGVFLESGRPEFFVAIATNVERLSRDYHRISVRIQLVDSKTISGGRVIHMSTEQTRGCGYNRRFCENTKISLVRSALYDL